MPIIPNDVWPSYTNQDLLDASSYARHRTRLWHYNYSVSLWPQIFSWTVCNIYAASPKHDFYFEPQFADSAIIVDVQWHTSGRGCANMSCYHTYPRGRVCTRGDPPIIFPTGDRSQIVACQPACYAKRRTRDLLKSAPRDKSLVNQTDPTSTCEDCRFLSPTVAYGLYTRELDGTFKQYDYRKGGGAPVHFLDQYGAPVTTDKNDEPVLDTDMAYYVWDPDRARCVVGDEGTMRNIAEPYWRDPSHSVCKSTNFALGDDPVWGFRPESNSAAYTMLAQHSKTYCRTFGKNRQPDGSCELPWWHKALTYTLIGDGLVHWARHQFEGERACSGEFWRPTSDERSAGARLTFDSTTSYSVWRRDVNKAFRLPPPNVLLSDLGINVRYTGNRLYWNSVEGVVSHMAMFVSVEQVTAAARRRRSAATEDEHAAMYRSYRGESAGGGRSAASRVRDPWRARTERQTEAAKRLASRITRLRDLLLQKFNRMSDRIRATQLLDEEMRDRTDDQKIAVLQTLFRAQQQQQQQQTAAATPSETAATATEDPKVLVAGRSVFAADRGLDAEVRAAWAELQASLADREFAFEPQAGSSVAYAWATSEHVEERFLSQFLFEDSMKPSRQTTDQSDPSTTPASSPLVVEPSVVFAQHDVARGGGGGGSSELDDVLSHIEDMENESKLAIILQDISISVGADIALSYLKKAIKRGYRKLLLFIGKQFSGMVGKAALKVGLRIGVGRIVGVIAARLTTKIMMIIGSAASVVGIGVAIVQLISLGLDIAEIAGWDPGHYKNETDLDAYRDMAVAWGLLLTDQQIGAVQPYETMIEIMSAENGTVDAAAADRNDNLSANSNPDATVATAAAASGKGGAGSGGGGGSGSTPRGQRRARRSLLGGLLSATRRGAAAATAAQAGGGPGDTASGGGGGLHIDEMISTPKWFNRHWPQCFEDAGAAVQSPSGQGFAAGDDDDDDDDAAAATVVGEDESGDVATGLAASTAPANERNALVDSQGLFHLLCTFQYLGARTTNSFGQRLKDDPVRIALTDSDLQALMVERDYRDLLTTSVKRSVDNGEFNRRVRSSQYVSRIALYSGIFVAAFGSLFLLTARRKSAGDAIVSSVLLLVATVACVCCFVYLVLVFIPVKTTTTTTELPSSTTENARRPGSAAAFASTNDDGGSSVTTTASATAPLLSTYVAQLRQFALQFQPRSGAGAGEDGGELEDLYRFDSDYNSSVTFGRGFGAGGTS